MSNSEPKDYDPNYVPVKQYFLVGVKAIVIKESKILLLQRSEKAGGGGKWTLPGGGLDHDDLDTTIGITREIKEETTLEVVNIFPFAVQSNTVDEHGDYAVIIGFKCDYLGGKVVLNWEHNNYKWVTKQEALTMNLTSSGRYFVDKFQG